MRTLTSRRRVAGSGLVTVALSGGMLGCSSDGSGSAPGSGTHTVWDPYPQFENGSARVQLLDKCGSATGVTVKRSGFDYGIIPIPAVHGGTAPAPTGREFVTVPVQKKTARYATSEKLVTCPTSADCGSKSPQAALSAAQATAAAATR